MNFPDWPGAAQRAWQATPETARVGLAVLAYLLVVSVMGMAAALISFEMPLVHTIPSSH